jgi:hypothetical protein
MEKIIVTEREDNSYLCTSSSVVSNNDIQWKSIWSVNKKTQSILLCCLMMNTNDVTKVIKEKNKTHDYFNSINKIFKAHSKTLLLTLNFINAPNQLPTHKWIVSKGNGHKIEIITTKTNHKNKPVGVTPKCSSILYSDTKQALINEYNKKQKELQQLYNKIFKKE